MNSRKCDVFIIDVQRECYQKHLRSKKHIENKKQNEMIIPKWLFQEPIQNKIKKLRNSRSLKQIARENITLDDKQLNKELAKKMLNPYYFADRNLKTGFKINLKSLHINNAISKLTIQPNYSEFSIETRYIDKILKQMATIYTRLINQYKIRYQTVFSARFDKQDENIQVLDETELFINLNINQNLTQIDIDEIDVKSPLEYQIQQQEMKDSGWSFDKINTKTIYFYKTGEI